MTLKTREHWLYGLGGSILLLVIGFFLNIRQERIRVEEAEFNRKFNLMYEVALTEAIRDTLVNKRVNDIELRLTKHELETSMSIANIQQSIIQAQKQMSELDKIQQSPYNKH